MTQKTSSRLALPAVLLLVLLLASSSAQAAEPYDVVVTSTSFEPGHAVNVEVTGLVNQSISIRITDANGDILSGRDTQTNATGQYVYTWVPSQEGEFNATVTFATGITITKSFLIQEKVTDEDVAQIYYALFGIRDRLTAEIESLKSLLNYTILMAALSLMIVIALTLYVRTLPRKKTEFEMFIDTERKKILEVLGVTFTEKPKPKEK